MSKRAPNLTTYVLPAAQSPLALVIRRGPSKWWHFMLWDRDTGVVTPGSWFHGIVHPWRCDLSPRGDWAIMLAYRATNTPPAWTALFQPPYITAQVFWPLEHAKVGGGFFDGRLPVLWLNFAMQDSEAEVRARHPWEFGFHEGEDPTWYGGTIERLERDGWKAIKAPAGATTSPRWRKASARRNGELIAEFHGDVSELADPSKFFEPGLVTYSFQSSASGSTPLILDGVTWAGFNSRGEVCIARGSHLALLRFPAEGSPSEVPVMDLAGLVPRTAPSSPIVSPAAALKDQ